LRLFLPYVMGIELPKFHNRYGICLQIPNSYKIHHIEKSPKNLTTLFIESGLLQDTPFCQKKDSRYSQKFLHTSRTPTRKCGILVTRLHIGMTNSDSTLHPVLLYTRKVEDSASIYTPNSLLQAKLCFPIRLITIFNASLS